MGPVACGGGGAVVWLALVLISTFALSRAVMLAVLVTAAAWICTMTFTCAVAPAAIVPRLQVTLVTPGAPAAQEP